MPKKPLQRPGFDPSVPDSKRRARTRIPPGEGGPDNLKPTRTDQKAKTLLSAKVIFEKLKELGLPLNEDSWKVAMAAADPGGASWRATYRPHVTHLFADLRDAASSGGLTEKKAQMLRDERDRALKCVQEYREENDRLKDRVKEVEAENAKLSRGSRSRRKRKPRQDRQAPKDDAGSD